MIRCVRHAARLAALLVCLALVIPPTPAPAEVHYFCTILAAKTCGQLRARSTSLLDRIARQAGDDAAARQTIQAVRVKVSADSLTGPDLVKLARAMRAAAPPRARTEIKNALGEMAVNQQVQLWLLKGVPGNTQIPAGANVPIALVPGMPRGQIVSVGFGPVLIGVDQSGSSIVLGQGDVQQVADEISRSETSKLSVSITLANPTDAPVSYTINQQPCNMDPKLVQDLRVGTAWTIAFDRGNNKGTARYRLDEGYYEFAVNAQGWELYKKQRPANSDAAEPVAGSQETAEVSTYPQSLDLQLPKNFKLFDPVPAIAGNSPGVPAAQLPEHFTLFRAAAAEIAAQEPPQ